MGGSAARPVGLDFNACFSMGSALNVDANLLAAVLPAVETAMLLGDQGDEDGDISSCDG